jgi:hypothetical protein
MIGAHGCFEDVAILIEESHPPWPLRIGKETSKVVTGRVTQTLGKTEIEAQEPFRPMVRFLQESSEGSLHATIPPNIHKGNISSGCETLR